MYFFQLEEIEVFYKKLNEDNFFYVFDFVIKFRFYIVWEKENVILYCFVFGWLEFRVIWYVIFMKIIYRIDYIKLIYFQ